MRDLLKKLMFTPSVSGREEKIREVIYNEIKDYCDEISTDAMGNLIARKKGNGKKIYGAYSDAKSMLTKPAIPVSFSVTLKSRTAKIKWAKATGAQGYEIYMSNSRNGSYKKIKSVGSGTTSYSKTGLVKGKRYYFKMRAYTKTGTGTKIYSGYSKIKAVTVK